MSDQLSDAEIDAEADQGDILLQTREAQREVAQDLDALSAKLKVLAVGARMQQRVTALWLLLAGFAIGFALVLAFAEDPAEQHRSDLLLSLRRAGWPLVLCSRFCGNWRRKELLEWTDKHLLRIENTFSWPSGASGSDYYNT